MAVMNPVDQISPTVCILGTWNMEALLCLAPNNWIEPYDQVWQMSWSRSDMYHFQGERALIC